MDRGRGQGSRAEKHLPLGSLRDSFPMSVVLLKRNEARALLRVRYIHTLSLSLSLSLSLLRECDWRECRWHLICIQGKWWCTVRNILVPHFPCRFASLGNFSFSNGFGLWFGSTKQQQFSSSAEDYFFSVEILVCGLLEIIILLWFGLKQSSRVFRLPTLFL